VVHNQTLVTWEHPAAGTVRQPRHPVRFASSATPVPETAAQLGQHSDEILREIGRSEEAIVALREAGVVA
jgi:crotonobetainyl-CoA:carnitine CoA-transferase CaiB-like acyl-CoA transferase